jgi:hypothetical protein
MLFVLVALIVVTMLAPRVMRWVFGAVGIIILFAILQTFQAKAADGDMPMIDPTGVCQSLIQTSGQVGDLSRAIKQCVANEQEAYNSARQEWPLASGTAKEICADMVRKHVDNPPYELLETCLYAHSEQDALSTQGPFRF